MCEFLIFIIIIDVSAVLIRAIMDIFPISYAEKTISVISLTNITAISMIMKYSDNLFFFAEVIESKHFVYLAPIHFSLEKKAHLGDMTTCINWWSMIAIATLFLSLPRLPSARSNSIHLLPG